MHNISSNRYQPYPRMCAGSFRVRGVDWMYISPPNVQNSPQYTCYDMLYYYYMIIANSELALGSLQKKAQ